MNQFDQTILNLLLQNGRMSYSKIADQVNLSPSACLRRIKALKQRGIIDHFTVILNARAMGQQIRAFVSLKVNRHEVNLVQQFLDKVTTYPEVISCNQLTGQNDFILEVFSCDLDSYADFINEKILAMPVVLDASSSIVLKQIKIHQTEIPNWSGSDKCS